MNKPASLDVAHPSKGGNTYTIYDGEIDMNSNYTGFLEVIGKSLLLI